jgi:hydrogenase nickel incorporation protein HypA/HybF
VHEVALAHAVWRQVDAEMAHHPGRRLLAAHVVVGAMSGADPESLEFALSLMAGASDWPQAGMCVRREPVTLRCRACGRQYEMTEMSLVCTGCGGADVDPVGGMDLRLESLEVE